MRKQIVHKPTGTVIHGTYAEKDLLPAFLDEADSLRLSKDERDQIREIRRCTRSKGYFENGVCPECDVPVARSLMIVMDILTTHAAPFCYFGHLDRDWSDFGWWICDDAVKSAIDEGDVIEQNNPRFSTEAQYVLVVNDHGNRTLHHRSNGRVIWDTV